jgi:hypothetical protein
MYMRVHSAVRRLCVVVAVLACELYSKTTEKALMHHTDRTEPRTSSANT